MPSVTDLSIKIQSGTTNSYVATWSFEDQKITNNSELKKGSLVTIKPGSKYYNGVSIPQSIIDDKWYLIEVSGDRAVLGENIDRNRNICSPININSLNEGSGTENVSDTLDYYEVKWTYDTGDQIWYKGTEENVKEKHSVFAIPDNAILVKVEVTPVSKKHTVNNEETSYWTGTRVTAEAYPDRNPPEQAETPTVTIDAFSLTATLDNIPDPRADKIEFIVYNNDSLYTTGICNVTLAHASFTCQVSPGGEYRVQARAINIVGSGQILGQLSQFSSPITTIPSPPEHITECRAKSKTSIYVAWDASSTANEYTLSYTTEERYFDSSNQVDEIGSIKSPYYEVTGLETGKEYFFRVAASNDSGKSKWSEIKSVIIGTKPAAPTTWSSSTTVITGEPLILYWMHNSADNSREVRAELELDINGEIKTVIVENNTPEDEKIEPGHYEIDTNVYNEGTKIHWRVKTCGITQEYGDYSVDRVIDIYARPSVTLHISDFTGSSIHTLTTFPINVNASTFPNTQNPIGYHLTIYSNSFYATYDNIGNIKYINIGDVVYSRHFDIQSALSVPIKASDVNLVNGCEYTISCVASMDSGLTATSSLTFDVKWLELWYEPNAEISVDSKKFIAYIQPYCRSIENGELVKNVSLSVYRKEFDGTFTEIARDLDNFKNIVITDPHPALDYARYRIVAKNTITGTLGYYDPPPYPVGGKSIVIQWDERRVGFSTDNPNSMVIQPWSGSILILPYNIEVSDNPSMEVEFVNYIGRTNPIAYYGTQTGYSSSWSTAIPKTDVDTLYAIRKLSNWAGNVYVREPSGTGYWANVVVSYNQKYDSLIIPITFSIKRVEGGV